MHPDQIDGGTTLQQFEIGVIATNLTARNHFKMFIWNTLKRPIRNLTSLKEDNSLDGSDGLTETSPEKEGNAHETEKRIKIASSPSSQSSTSSQSSPITKLSPTKWNNHLVDLYRPITRTLTESTIIIDDDNSVDPNFGDCDSNDGSAFFLAAEGKLKILDRVFHCILNKFLPPNLRFTTPAQNS